jgi:hypothetical protein
MSLFIKNDRIVAFDLTEVKCAKINQNSKRKAFLNFLETCIHIYYILLNEILRNIDEIKCIFSFSVFSL